jgi:hypothetical protein
MLASDLRVSLLIVWGVVSLVVLGVLATPFVLDEGRILRLAPACISRTKYGQDCFACGLTRSFVLISQGRFHEAASQNKAGPPLYAAFAINTLAFFLRLGQRLGRGPATTGRGRTAAPETRLRSSGEHRYANP